MFKKFPVLISACSLIFALLLSTNANAALVKVGEATNNTVVSAWQGFKFDVSSLISGATDATLSFDLRNDAPPHHADSTTSEVWLDSSDSLLSVKLNYLKGSDTSHWRNVQLLVDGKLYVDQFGAYNNHLGDADFGTSFQGVWGSGNVAGQNGDGSTIFALAPEASSTPISDVPVPAAIWLFGTALMGLLGSRRKSSPVVALA